MMKAKANIKFNDLKAKVTREVGDEFECSKRRFDEIVGKLGENALTEIPRVFEPEGEDE